MQTKIMGLTLALFAVGMLDPTGLFTSAADTSKLVAPQAPEMRVTQLLIVYGAKSSGPEIKAADILKDRILKRSAVTAETVREDASDAAGLMNSANAIFVVGSPAGNKTTTTLMRDLKMSLPTLPNSTTLHPEGFAVKTGALADKHYVVIAGTDERGTLYGVGCVLRALTYLPDAVLIPSLDVQDKPAFPLRGGQPTGPGSRARQYGKLRPQTQEEATERMEDLMLLGTNIFGGNPATIHTYGMMTTFGRTANEMPAGFPAAWRADNGRSTRYVCPSVPEARKALLESFDKMFRDCPDYDFFTTNSGDTGGCRCDKCMPWGATYIKLVHEIADILHKYHPNTKVLATNQDLTNVGNQAIFDYLNKGDSSWLYAIRYGPGADEMQTYIRGPVNPRWFEYEGFGPLGNYLKYMLHELPRTTNIVLYSDITHWMQSQYAVQHPDVALAAVYERRSWNARPRNFYKVGQETLHYALGDMHYSEGMHDDFNKWFWYRLLWNPHQSAESITKGYCRYWFGPDAEDEMAKAIFIMEETLEKPVLGNPGIAKAVELVRDAGKKIPENLLKLDWRWRVISEKALMDRYIQLELERGNRLKQDATKYLTEAETGADPKAAIEKAVTALEQPLETDKMKAIMQEALDRGEESNKVIGYREPAPFLVGKLDLTEVGWWTKELKQALDDGSETKLRNAAKMILHYNDPGEGGYYENLGWPNESHHLKRGESLWGFQPFNGPARQSYYNLAYSMGKKDQGVALEFDGLDPKAQYVVRLSAGAHIDADMPALKNAKLVEGLMADGQVVNDNFEIPMDDVDMYEFNVPKSATADGKVRFEFVPKSDAFPVTGLDEIWLMRKDKMPWTAHP